MNYRSTICSNQPLLITVPNVVERKTRSGWNQFECTGDRPALHLSQCTSEAVVGQELRWEVDLPKCIIRNSELYVNASYKQLFHWDQCEKVNPACEYERQSLPAGWVVMQPLKRHAVMRCARSRSSAHTVFLFTCALALPHTTLGHFSGGRGGYCFLFARLTFVILDVHKCLVYLHKVSYFRYSTWGYFQVACKIGNGWRRRRGRGARPSVGGPVVTPALEVVRQSSWEQPSPRWATTPGSM